MSEFSRTPKKQKAQKPEVKSRAIKKKVTEKDIEKWEVAQLCSNIEPRSKPSDIFEKLEEKRRTKHEKLLQEFANDLHKVNLETENNIKMSSIELKAHIKDYNEKLNDILQDLNKPEVIKYCKSAFMDIQTTADKYKSHQRKLISELHHDLNKFEDERARKNGKIFQNSCSEISKVGYFLPYEVQMFVEHEILKMNKLSLNNRRCYEDLNLTLTLVTEEMYKSFMDKVFCIRESWLQQNTVTCIPIVSTVEEKVSRTESEGYVRHEVEGQELHLSMNSLGQETCTITEWNENVQKILASITCQCVKLTNLSKKILMSIYNGFPEEEEDLKTELSLTHSWNMNKRFIKELIVLTEDIDYQVFEEMEGYWQNTVVFSHNHLKKFTKFLQELGKLWTRHTDRICESKKLILSALEKVDLKNRTIIEDLEIKLNLSMDDLRQEYDEGKMQKAYDDIVTTLEAMKENYESTYLEEVSIVEDFYKMMVLEADVLSADIDEFTFDLYPTEHWRNMTPVQRGPQRSFFEDEQPLVKDMFMLCEKIYVLFGWKDGACLALENLSTRTRKALQPRAESWVNKKIQVLSEKRTVQLELTEKRFSRIRIEILEKRQDEVKSHAERLDSHKQKVEFVLKQLQEGFQFLLEKESDKVDNITENLDELEAKVMIENRPGIIRGNGIMLGRRKEEIETNIRTAFDRFRAQYETKVSDLQQSNIQYMKSITFFHEGGNYSTEEGKVYIDKLEEVDKEITAELKNIDKDSRKEEAEMMKEISAALNPIITLCNLLYEETLFIQETQQRIRNFMQDIREMTNTFRLDYEFLSSQCGILCRRLKTSSDGDEEEKIWNFLIELLYRNVSALIYPISLQEIIGSSVDETVESGAGEGTESPCCCAGKFTINFGSSKSQTFQKSEKQRPLNCPDYREKLCEKPQENDGTFFTIVGNYFWDEMGTLQEIACDFYSKIQGRQIIREDLIPKNYNLFINDILTKFRYFKTQLQQFWLQLILVFLPLIGNVKELANSCLEKKLKDYKEAALETLENFYDSFKNCVERQKCEYLKELEDLDKKLLPLHGYPQNVDLLNGLEEEVVRKTANQKIEWEEIFRKFKNEIKCFRLQHIHQKIELSKIEMMYSKFQATIFVDDLGSNLLDAIMDRCSKFGSNDPLEDSLGLEREFSLEEEATISGEVPVEHKLEILLPEADLHTVRTYVRQLTELIEIERSPVPPSKCPPCPETSEESFYGESLCLKFCRKLNVLLEIIDLEQHVNEILEKLNESLWAIKSLTNGFEKTNEAELFKWLAQWKDNVNKVLKLYSVMNEGTEEQEKYPEVTSQQSVENNKPQHQKTTACVTSTLPRLCPTTTEYLRDTSNNTRKAKGQTLRNKSIPNESKKRPGIVDSSLKNDFKKSKLARLVNYYYRIRRFPNSSLPLISPRNYRGQIPVLRRYSSFAIMSPPDTRPLSPLRKVSQKEKISSKIKTITLDEEEKRTKKKQNSRSPSPVKKSASIKKNSKSKVALTLVSGSSQNSEKERKPKHIDSIKGSSSLEVRPQREKTPKETQIKSRDINTILKQTSQPSLSLSEKIQPQEKISLDHIKNEVYAGEHRRVSLEKVHLCIEQNFTTAERKRSFLVTYSSEELQNQNEISLSLLKSAQEEIQNGQTSTELEAIRTISGHELILTPSMKLDIDKDTDSIEIADILKVNGIEEKDVYIPQDDANEYDSELSTDGEIEGKNQDKQQSDDKKSKDYQNSLWKSREADLLNDVDYRQSVYHPAVSRRQNSGQMEFRPKSKSIEDNFGFPDKTSRKLVRTRSSTIKQNCFTDNMDSCNDKSWGSTFDKSPEKPILYNSVLQDVPFYDVKRIRTKKERISGAFLRFTLKMIRLLAIFNLWPGDNCHMLTSQSLRFAR